MDRTVLSELIAGGLAGTAVDVAMFPIDTIKTRLQSAGGFVNAGGFTGVYRGLLPAIIGSAPGSALFFSTYSASKRERLVLHLPHSNLVFFFFLWDNRCVW